jgi:hypothetical protein
LTSSARSFAADPGRSPQRLAWALTDQAIGCLVANWNASAADILREAHDLSATIDNDVH